MNVKTEMDFKTESNFFIMFSMVSHVGFVTGRVREPLVYTRRSQVY